MYKVIFAIALTCMLLQLGECETTCQIGNCGCNKKTINVSKPGRPVRNVDVCCPPSGSVTCSEYLRAGDATAADPPFCACDYVRVSGSCFKGEQCTSSYSIQAHINSMPLCCPPSSQLTVTPKTNANGQTEYSCGCIPWTGDCWVGDQCDDCGSSGSVNGFKLCCPNCTSNGLTIDAGAHSCYCNK